MVLVLAIAICISIMLIASPVFAVDYEVRADIGWQYEFPLSYYWGTSIIEASEVVSYLEAQTSGYQIYLFGWEKGFEVFNGVNNTWIAGITGYGELETSPGPNSYLLNVALGWWIDGGPIEDRADITPHPYMP